MIWGFGPDLPSTAPPRRHVSNTSKATLCSWKKGRAQSPSQPPQGEGQTRWHTPARMHACPSRETGPPLTHCPTAPAPSCKLPQRTRWQPDPSTQSTPGLGLGLGCGHPSTALHKLDSHQQTGEKSPLGTSSTQQPGTVDPLKPTETSVHAFIHSFIEQTWAPDALVDQGGTEPRAPAYDSRVTGPRAPGGRGMASCTQSRVRVQG